MVESSPGRRHHVMVAVEDSGAAQAALCWALDEAVVRHATVWVVHVWTYPRAMALPVASDISRATMQVHAVTLGHEMVEKKAMADADVEPEVEYTVVEGDPGTGILRAARHADLLVIGARRPGPLAALRLGSVTAQCVDHAPCPVVVVRARHPFTDEEPKGSSATPGGTGEVDP